ncbi:MAG: ATP-binding protein, partial [Methylococcales bacterium]
VVLWLDSDQKKWRVSRVWECPQSYPQDGGHIFNPNQIREKDSKRATQWDRYIRQNDKKTLVSRKLSEKNGNSVYYTHKQGEFTRDLDMGIDTQAQAVLSLRDTGSQENCLLGMFLLFFNQNPALNEAQQKPLLEYVAGFAASYLAIRRKNRAYLDNSLIAQQQVAVGEAYQQLRHSIKIQLGGINGLVDRLSLSLNRIQLPDPDSRTKVEGYVREIKSIFSKLTCSIDSSRTLVNAPAPELLDIREIWEMVRSNLKEAAENSAITITSMNISVPAYIDRETIKMVLTNLVGNAIEAMEVCSPHRLKQVECIALPESGQGFCRIAVRDTGPGVAPEIRGKLFDRIGCSTKAHGTGFQLYFCALKLRQNTARIEYDPDWTHGACFVLTVPNKNTTSND